MGKREDALDWRLQVPTSRGRDILRGAADAVGIDWSESSGSSSVRSRPSGKTEGIVEDLDGGAALATASARLCGFRGLFPLSSGLGDVNNSRPQTICSWAACIAINYFAGRVRGLV